MYVSFKIIKHLLITPLLHTLYFIYLWKTNIQQIIFFLIMNFYKKQINKQKLSLNTGVNKWKINI